MRATNFRGSRSGALLALELLMAIGIAAYPAVGEELVLKNGQKIVGTIVAYDNEMFRVETEYGFALIRKDKIQTVNFPAGVKGETSKKPQPAPPAAPGTTAASATARTEVPPTPGSVKPAAAVKPTPVPPPPSRPVDEPLPDHVQEHVEGTTYINDSFHFAMFKPPGWKVYEEVPKETGSATMAIGTEDEQTLLFVDRQVWSGTPDYKSDRAEAKLRATYQEYQKTLESPTEVGGHPAIRRAFKGVIDGAEWHGLSVHLAHGNAVFGIIGLTSAETYQFQQALFNKIINSFHFMSPVSPIVPAPSTSKP